MHSLSSPQKELALAAAQSSQLNKAYQTLLSPLDRAHYILSLHGVKESETERLEDDELIIQVMEARQEVDEASSIEELNKVKKINRGKSIPNIWVLHLFLLASRED